MGHSEVDLVWWITVIEIPALAGLFWLVLKSRADTRADTDELWAAFNTFQLEVAKTYASNEALKEAEKRIVSHLRRIEDKLGVYEPDHNREHE